MRSRSLMLLLSLAACRSASPAAPVTSDATSPEPAQSAAAPSAAIPSERTATLRVGDPAPAFSLVAEDGTTFELTTALARGPVVAVFYRGDW